MTLRHLGRVAAREIYRRRYAEVLDKLGPDHHVTRALLGRLRVYLGQVPSQLSVEIEAVAWRRESGTVGYWNRSSRRAFDRRMSIFRNQMEAPSALGSSRKE